MTAVGPGPESRATAPAAGRPFPMTPARAARALFRRARLAYLRLRHPRAAFGAGCDVRRGLHLLVGPGGRVEFGAACVLDHGATLECYGALTVGDRTIFGHHCTVGVRESVEIGDDCLIAELVSIRDHDHRFDRLDVPVREQGAACAPVRIGRNVWLGAKVTVLKGVRIGDNAVVGANAVVTKDVPANAVAVGIPARVVRMRA